MNDQIIKRIKKLLSLSQSHNENEAQLALVKAQELMIKHHIEKSQISFDEPPKIIHLTTEYYFTNYKNFYLCDGINELSDLYLCKVVFVRNKHSSKQYIRIIGNENDCRILQKVIGFIKSNVDGWTRQLKREYLLDDNQMINNFKNDYGLGFCRGLKSLLEMQRDRIQQEEGLVISTPKEAQDYVDSLEGLLSFKNANISYNQSLMDLGRSDGLQANIQNAI